MSKTFFFDSFIWGFVLWLIGYFLGIGLFMFVPVSLVGWVIMPIGALITFYVLIKKIKSSSLNYYFSLSFVWTLLAIVLDYFLLVKLFNPEDGYYKLDVYLYYFLTFLFPLVVGIAKSSRRRID